MNHSDIKLVIDLLDQIAYGDHDAASIESAIAMLETLGNKVAAQAAKNLINAMELAEKDTAIKLLHEKVAKQAAVIEKLTSWLRRERRYYLDAGSDIDEVVVEFLLSPTDSTQILQEWLTSQINLNGYSYSINDTYVLFSADEPPDDAYDEGSLVTLYAIKKPEILK